MKSRKHKPITPYEKFICDIVLNAMLNKRALEAVYKGQTRILEPHSIGFTRQGGVLMQCWQVGGGSNSRQSAGWKSIRLRDLKIIRISDQESAAPRVGFNRKGSGFEEVLYDVIDCQSLLKRTAARNSTPRSNSTSR